LIQTGIYKVQTAKGRRKIAGMNYLLEKGSGKTAKGKGIIAGMKRPPLTKSGND
jgi:hypothetical protein